MGLRIKFSVDSEGTTVPYGPAYDEVRRNHGFQDLRANPSAVEKILEITNSSVLKRLLVARAQPGYPIFSLGCDLGEHEDAQERKGRQSVAGGYVQIAAANYKIIVPASYHAPLAELPTS
jgi:hypothetical protein